MRGNFVRGVKRGANVLKKKLQKGKMTKRELQNIKPNIKYITKCDR